MAKFKVGDVVQLKSGGPEMTVESVPDASRHPNYGCGWFSGSKLQNGYFPEDALKTPEPKKS